MLNTLYKTVKIIKYTFKLIKRILLFFFSFVILYLFTAWVCSNITTSPKKEFTDKQKPIYVASNGVHTDIIIPISCLNKYLKNILNLNTSTIFVAFGWGDRFF